MASPGRDRIIHRVRRGEQARSSRAGASSTDACYAFIVQLPCVPLSVPVPHPLRNQRWLPSFCFVLQYCVFIRARRQRRGKLPQAFQVLCVDGRFQLECVFQASPTAQDLIPTFALAAQVRTPAGLLSCGIRFNAVCLRVHNSYQLAFPADGMTGDAGPLGNMFWHTRVSWSISQLVNWSDYTNHQSPID